MTDDAFVNMNREAMLLGYRFDIRINGRHGHVKMLRPDGSIVFEADRDGLDDELLDYMRSLPTVTQDAPA